MHEEFSLISRAGRRAKSQKSHIFSCTIQPRNHLETGCKDLLSRKTEWWEIPKASITRKVTAPRSNSWKNQPGHEAAAGWELASLFFFFYGKFWTYCNEDKSVAVLGCDPWLCRASPVSLEGTTADLQAQKGLRRPETAKHFPATCQKNPIV